MKAVRMRRYRKALVLSYAIALASAGAGIFRKMLQSVPRARLYMDGSSLGLDADQITRSGIGTRTLSPRACVPN
jgi:hypothetical protein